MINLADVRARAAMALAPASDADPQVIGLTDAVVAPCLQIAWAQPWLIPAGQLQSPVGFYSRLSLLLIGGRVEANGALEQLEALAGFALTRLALDPIPWAPQEVTAPRGTNIGGVEYLVARITVQLPIDASTAPLEVVA